MIFSRSNLKTFFDSVLTGESKTYDDHNWYTSSGLKSYIKGVNQNRNSALSKDLSDTTIADVLKFQKNQRSSSSGQLWATGRYQIIPTTLKGLTDNHKINTNQKYSEAVQDELGEKLLLGRSNLRKYLKKEVSDTKENREKAALDMAKIWSSIGVPYDMQGSRKAIKKNQSYYSGGGDKATVKTETVQTSLQKLRNSDNTSEETPKPDKTNGKILDGVFIALFLVGSYIFYKKMKSI
jgi:hypothetical protein